MGRRFDLARVCSWSSLSGPAVLALAGAALGGCLGDATPMASWDPVLPPASGWEVEYAKQNAEESDREYSRLLLRANGTAEHPFVGQSVDVVDLVLDGQYAGATYWMAGIPIGDEPLLPGSEYFMARNRAHLALSTMQTMMLPSILFVDWEGRTLPAGFPVEEWRERLEGAGAELELEWADSLYNRWLMEYGLDGSPFPRHVGIRPDCAESRCPGPFFEGDWRKVMEHGLEDARPPRDRLPPLWTTEPAGLSWPVFPAPAIDPGGGTVGLRASIDRARSSSPDVAGFLADNPEWFVDAARFEGSNRTGETRWRVGISSGTDATRLSFEWEASQGWISVMGGQTRTMNATITEGGFSRLPTDAALRVADMGAIHPPPRYCDGEWEHRPVTSIDYSLGPPLGYVLDGKTARDGQLLVVSHDERPLCPLSNAAVSYGLVEPTVMALLWSPWSPPT